MTKGAIFIRKQGDDEPRDATSPLEGYEYVGVVDGDVTFTTDGVEATGETFSADDVSHLLDGSITATIEDVDENLMRKLSGWTVLMADIEEGPGRDFAYVREDEPDYLHIVSALSAPFGIGMRWMEHDL